MSNLLRRIKGSRFCRHSKVIASSASFALLLSIACFLYETIDSKIEMHRITKDLKEVQNSLSTRYLGLFPEYIPNINFLLNEGLETYLHNDVNKVDTIVIFEDVLYYGIKSRPEGFRRMNELLLELANRNCQIFIAYYNPQGKAFQQMVRETLISTPLLASYEQDMQDFFRGKEDINREREKILSALEKPTKVQIDSINRILFHKHLDSVLHIDSSLANKSKLHKKSWINSVKEMDSIKCEEYFRVSYEVDAPQYKKLLKAYLAPIDLSKDSANITVCKVNHLCQEIDSIKFTTIGRKNEIDITYADYQNMYKGFTNILVDFYNTCGENVHLIPLNDYLTMSCWMISRAGGSKAIFAFPSKYATEEIGFISQDEAIAIYIKTMLHGVQFASSK